MPNPTPANPAPGPSPATTGPGRLKAWLWRIWRLGHGASRAAWRAFLLFLCLLLYLWLIGVPGFLVQRLLDRLDSRPFRLGLDWVTFDPTAGLVVSGVYLYHEEDFSEPMARVQRVILEPDWAALLERRLALKALTIEQGSIHPPVLPRSNAPPVRLDARSISGRLELRSDRVELAPLHMHLLGVNWHTTGTILRAAHGDGGGGFWRELAAVRSALVQAPAATADVVAELNAVQFDPPPEAQVAIHFNPARSNDWSMRVQAEGKQALIRGATFDTLSADLSLEGYQLTLNNLSLGALGKRGHLTGSMDLATRLVSARLYSDLPPDPWVAMMPRPWQRGLRDAGIKVAGTMRSEVWIGPAPLEELASHMHGWVSLEKASVRGIPLARGYGSVRVEGPIVSVEEISAVVGQQEGRGPMEGRVLWQRDRQEISGELSLNFDPHLALPVLSSNQAMLVRRFAFAGPPPHFTGRFIRRGGPTPDLELEGQLRATACSYRGVAITSLVSALQVKEHQLHLDPMSFSRPDGTISGALHYDFNHNLITVDLAGIMDPHAVAGLVGPGLSKVLSYTRYEGPVHMTARGVVDVQRGDDRTDLWVGVDGQRLGVTNWLADTARLDLHALGGTYITTNATGTAFGGVVNAAVYVQPDASGSSHTYRATATLTNAELALIAAHVRTNIPAGTQGRVRLDVSVEGPVLDPDLRLVTGSGELRVDKGEVMRLPLFGGLSRLLSVLYPGLGFAAQNNLHAQFEVSNGRVVTKDARLEGTVISMKAKGYYAFDGKVRFQVEVQLLRKGPLASVLRLVTLPVTKLLIFQLSGTVHDPQWRPVNLPKELFLIFE